MVAKRKIETPKERPISEETRAKLMRLVNLGFASWDGGKPEPFEPRLKLTKGPDLSDYINEDRR